MKKLSLLFLLTFLCQTSFAQKCKFDYDKADPFTGKRTVSIKPDLAKGWGMAIMNTGGNCDISVSVLVGGVTKNMINKGDTLLMAIENGLPIVLSSNAEYAPVSNVAGSTVYTSYTATYSINRKDLKRLAEGKMVALRMYAGGTAFNTEVKEKNALKISKAAECVGAEQ